MVNTRFRVKVCCFSKTSTKHPVSLPSPLLVPSPDSQPLHVPPIPTPAPLHLVPTEDENNVLVPSFSEFEESSRPLCKPSLYKSAFSEFLSLLSPPTFTYFELFHSDRVITSTESIIKSEEKEQRKKEKEVCDRLADEKHKAKQQLKLANSGGKFLPNIVTYLKFLLT